ncbi:hypothetical protein GWO73_04400 [Corynebacterium macginleyi]|uniref:hypothetical protein n=1 Tax=Corynebacterium macginleyi TaxID=38290 RepID=UPI00190A1B5A|nr:hypothetical protein [Corynebacterium macginleyi]MBK4161068.1 hypothetical protein [Corynebacterium macginleyi]
MTVKPSDLAHRRLAAAKKSTHRKFADLTTYADEATHLMDHFTSCGHDVDTALTLTEITLDRFDDERRNI